MTITENHPFSALTAKIEQLLWASIILSSAVATVSLINMGRLSLFMAPIMFGFTLLHNGVLLGLLSRDRKRFKLAPDSLANTLAPTASKAAIICTWVLMGFWCIVVFAVIVVSVLIMTMNQFEGWERLAGYVEIPLEVAEIGLLLVIALKCRAQRRSTIIQPAHVDWEHYRTA